MNLSDSFSQIAQSHFEWNFVQNLKATPIVMQNGMCQLPVKRYDAFFGATNHATKFHNTLKLEKILILARDIK